MEEAQYDSTTTQYKIVQLEQTDNNMEKGRLQLHHVRPATRSDRSTSEMLDERERLLLRVLLPPRQSLDSRAERGCDSF